MWWVQNRYIAKFEFKWNFTMKFLNSTRGQFLKLFKEVSNKKVAMILIIIMKSINENGLILIQNHWYTCIRKYSEALACDTSVRWRDCYDASGSLLSAIWSFGRVRCIEQASGVQWTDGYIQSRPRVHFFISKLNCTSLLPNAFTEICLLTLWIRGERPVESFKLVSLFMPFTS